MNKVILSGTIEKDIEIKSTSGGNQVVTLQVKAYNDETKKSFLLMDCVFWNDKATKISQCASKNDYIEIEGRISKNGFKVGDKTQYRTEIIVDRFEIVNNVGVVQNKPTREEVSYDNDNVFDLNDDDIPF